MTRMRYSVWPTKLSSLWVSSLWVSSLCLLCMSAAGCVRIIGPPRVAPPGAGPAVPPTTVPGDAPTALGSDLGSVLRRLEAFGKDRFLGSENGVLLTVCDAMIRPGEVAVLTATLRGSELRGLAGHTLEFSLEGRRLAEADTDASGTATTAVRLHGAGHYTVRVRWLRGPMVLSLSAAELLVAVRPAEQPMIVVDLDGTIVEEHLATGLLSETGGRVMPGAVESLSRLTDSGWAVVYLTARPEQLHVRNRRWLEENRLPRGPLFEGPLEEAFSSGGRAGKTRMLRLLRERFPRIAVGVGDKASDAWAYADTGLTPYLLVRPRPGKPKDLAKAAAEVRTAPVTTQFATDWADIAESVLGPTPRTLDRGAMLARLGFGF